MASTINATTNGIVNIGDSVATLALQTGGTTAVAIDTAQIVTLSKSLALLGSTSGSVTIAAPAVAGSTTLTLPATSGTLLQSGTAVTIAQGGTGQTTASAAFDALAPSQTSNSGKYLTTNGTTTSWGTVSGGSPGGSNTQIQFNNSSAFGGSANLVWDGTYVGVGTSSPSTYADTTPGLATYNSSAGGRSGISLGSNSTAADDILGAVNFFSSNTSNTNYRMAKVLGMRGADANSSYLRFDTANSGNPAESLRLNGAGTLILKGGSTSATGVGIAFPATQSASTDANTLDDYEEGTYTPTITNVTYTGHTVTGKYTKVGNLVYVYITFTGGSNFVSTVNSSSITIPFSASAQQNCFAVQANAVGYISGLVNGGTLLIQTISYNNNVSFSAIYAI